MNETTENRYAGRWPELRARLLRQDDRCAVCGELIEPEPEPEQEQGDDGR